MEIDGQVIENRYLLLERLGSGGMGEVYRALDRVTGQDVAVKLLLSALCERESSRKRFAREAQAAQKLNHPGIVKVYEYGTFHGRPFIVMELLTGKSLRYYVRAYRPSPENILLLTAELCDALYHAHSRGIIHRDLKPDNIFVNHLGHIKVLDFGLAKISFAADLTALTKSGTALGTCTYMSPEQAQGKEADLRSDLYAVGVILYEIFCGITPFSAEDAAAILRMQVYDKAQRPTSVDPHLPIEIEQIIMWLMNKNPKYRPNSALVLKEKLIQVVRMLRIGAVHYIAEPNPETSPEPQSVLHNIDATSHQPTLPQTDKKVQLSPKLTQPPLKDNEAEQAMLSSSYSSQSYSESNAKAVVPQASNPFLSSAGDIWDDAQKIGIEQTDREEHPSEQFIQNYQNDHLLTPSYSQEEELLDSQDNDVLLYHNERPEHQVPLHSLKSLIESKEPAVPPLVTVLTMTASLKNLPLPTLSLTQLAAHISQVMREAVEINGGFIILNEGANIKAAFIDEYAGLRAVRSIIRTRMSLRQLGQNYHLLKLPPIASGIYSGLVKPTLAKGPFTVDNMRDLLSGATRLSNLSNSRPNEIFICGDSLDEGIQARFVRRIYVRNRTAPVEIYRVIGLT